MPAFHLHPVILAATVLLACVHLRAVHERARRWRALWAWLVWALVVLWPIGDLAASVSLSVATLQRLVLMLGVAPLLLASTTTRQLASWTRARGIDALTRRLAHPAVAMAVVTLVGTATLTTPVVDAGATSSLMRVFTLVVVLGCGVVLWIPALGVMPGAKRLSPVGRAAFIFVASLVVTGLSFVWIFARHSLYPSLHGQVALMHMTPLLDQQVAGFVAKLGSYLPMWAVAFTIFSRADESGVDVEASPLHWADVERQLLRVDRQRARALRRRGSQIDGS